jgi:broad specificity phosphatase PhoE
MQVILVRHGETAANRDRIVLGRGDPPLTELGLRQAEHLADSIVAEIARGLQVDAVYASPLSRTFRTAETLASRLHLPVIEAPGLIEMDIGETEGLPATELRQRFPEFMKVWMSREAGEAKMPGGESLADVQARAWPIVERLREEHRPEAAVVAVSHNFVIRTVVCKALAVDLAEFRRFEQDLASITRIEFRGPRTLVTSLNETCHLG